MQEVTVKLSSENITREYALNFPSSWNELSEKQLLFVGKHWTAWQALMKLGEPVIKARAMLVIVLSDLKGRRERLKFCETLSFIDENSGGNILDITNFIFEKNNLTKNLLPRVKVSWLREYAGPSDYMGDIDAEEFSFAFGIYLQFVRTHNEDLLTTLMAVLYRPARFDEHKTGENRQPFNKNLIEYHAGKLAKLPDCYRQAVYLFFLGCLEFMAGKHPNVFKRAEKAGGPGGTFLDSVVALSGGKFGPFESTKKTNIYILLKELDLLIANKPKK